jgi:osmoprotectant transport system ATP-binding protein
MIRLERLTKQYASSAAPAVREVSLHVAQSSVLALVGSSGCGKTTTLKMINRLIEPTSGTVIIDGQDIRQVDPVQLRRSIGYVFQMIGLMPHWSVADNVATVPGLLGWTKARTHDRVDELLNMVGLDASEFRDRKPSQLSGGQRQRVGFARALAAGPKVMLLDEPFGAIDPIVRSVLQDEFRTLQKKLGLTVVMVTHDMTEALLLADQVAVMHDGLVLQSGTPHELLTEPGHPYVAELVQTPRRQAQVIDNLIESGGAA